MTKIVAVLVCEDEPYGTFHFKSQEEYEVASEWVSIGADKYSGSAYLTTKEDYVADHGDDTNDDIMAAFDDEPEFPL